MFKNYLKITLRNLWKYKGYSLINVSGLAVGMACFIMITMWSLDELSYDKFHNNIDRLYRINTISSDGTINPHSSLRLGEEMQTKYHEIEAYTNFIPWARSLLKYEDKVFDETDICLVDPDFFSMFTFEFLLGDPSTALADISSVVITNETAKKYFGDQNPIGKQLYSVNYDRLFKVSAVIKKTPDNSTLKFNIAARIELISQQRRESWEFSGWTYFLLKENISKNSFNKKIIDFYRKYVDPETDLAPVLQNYSSLHLYENGEPGLIQVVYVFSIVGIFILIIAFVNFSNLSTARATIRAREVGIRKVNGAQRFQLIFQFLFEAIFISLISLVIAIIIILLFLPYFNQFSLKSLNLFDDNFLYHLLGIGTLALFTCIISGSYPAFILSSVKPVSILQGKLLSPRGSSAVRRVLTIAQFVISIVLIICTIIVSNQMQYIQEIDLGMDRSNIIVLDSNEQLLEKFDTFKSELLKYPSIHGVSASATRPFDVGQVIPINWEGNMDEEARTMQYSMVDYDFLKTLNMKLLAGRSFSQNYVNDVTESCLINESAAAILNFDNPIGKNLYFGHPAFAEELRNLKIIGIVKDFHSRSLHSSISPFVFKMYRPWHTYTFIKIDPINVDESVKYIKLITKKIAPDYPVKFEFLDESYNKLYAMESKLETIFLVFAALTILISCLGLYGLTTFIVAQKTKEIGIRKVLGASIFNISRILIKQFTTWVVIANLIAWPIAYDITQLWLEQFSYRVDMNYLNFLLAGLLSLFISLIAVVYQTLKAAYQNPINSIRKG